MSDLDEFDESAEEDETLEELGLWTGSKSQTVGPARKSKTEATSVDINEVKSVQGSNENAQTEGEAARTKCKHNC